MAQHYESPKVKILGPISDLTQAKPGIYSISRADLRATRIRRRTGRRVLFPE